LIRVERGRFLKLLPDTHDGVRFFVPIDPGHFLSSLYGYCLWIEGEVFDLYFVLLRGGFIGVLHVATEREDG
jgi:hypothetical protein